jgi:hypothetical protein
MMMSKLIETGFGFYLKPIEKECILSDNKYKDYEIRYSKEE